MSVASSHGATGMSLWYNLAGKYAIPTFASSMGGGERGKGNPKDDANAGPIIICSCRSLVMLHEHNKATSHPSIRKQNLIFPWRGDLL